jgi:hypothetical protein
MASLGSGCRVVQTKPEIQTTYSVLTSGYSVLRISSFECLILLKAVKKSLKLWP